MVASGISRPVGVVLVVIAALLFATGAAWGLAWVTHHTTTHSRALPAGSSIDIESGSGDVLVVGGDRSDVRLTTKERRSIFGTPHVSVRYEAGRLHLDSDCGGAEFFANQCSASFRLDVPRAMALRLAASSGDVHADDVAGRLIVRASSGDIHVDAPSRDIDARATSGDIHVHASDAWRVRAQATSGDVHVSVPDDTYAVHTAASSGDQHVDVRQDPDAPRHIEATATSGDVHVASDG